MVSPARLDLDAFPDSPYAQEFRRGLSGLRFAPPLEQEYVLTHLARVHLRVRVWVLLALGFLTLYTLTQVLRTGAYSPAAIAHYVLLALTAVVAWIVFSSRFERLYLRIAWLFVPVSGCAATFFGTQAAAAGRFELLVTLATMLVSVFFLSGALLRTTTLTAVLMVATFIGSGVFFGLAPELIVGATGMLVLTACIGFIIGWDIEKSYRESFLEAGLIGELAACDGLTGLKNRRAFDEYLPRIWQEALRERRPLALMLIDVDEFKRYNDLYGHQAGDETLRHVARIVGSHIRRPRDCVARYGGEEFIAVLYDLPPEGVSELAERLRRAVERAGIVHGDSSVSDVVTVSIGAALVRPSSEKEPAKILELADKALYCAKRGGRNRVVFLEEENAFTVTGIFAKGSLRRKA